MDGWAVLVRVVIVMGVEADVGDMEGQETRREARAVGLALCASEADERRMALPTGGVNVKAALALADSTVPL